MSDKVLFITDTHLGARGGSKVFRELFRLYYKEELFPFIKENNIKTIIHAGDFFDNRNSLSLNDIDFVINEFIPLLEDSGATMHVITGNHDIAYKNTNKINSLSILKTSDNIRVIDNGIEVVETEGKKFVLCPWLNRENSDLLLEDLKYYADDDHILVGHFEIEGAKMYKSSKIAESGLKPSQLKNFHKVLSGHFHHRNILGNIEYIGALFHYNWQDHNDWRGFQVYDPDTNYFELHENEYCLFTKLDFHVDEVCEMSKEDLKDLCENQFVRIVINDEYNKVDLKEVVSKIEKFNPISVDVIDNTVIPNEVNTNEIEVSDTKEIEDYVSDYVNEDESILELFSEVKSEAELELKEFG